MPERVQLRRTKGWRKPEGAVVVARPSKWGNPFVIGPDLDRDEAVERYRPWVIERFGLDVIRTELAGRDLACWCPLDAACHVDVLLELASREADPEGQAQADRPPRGEGS